MDLDKSLSTVRESRERNFATCVRYVPAGSAISVEVHGGYVRRITTLPGVMVTNEGGYDIFIPYEFIRETNRACDEATQEISEDDKVSGTGDRVLEVRTREAGGAQGARPGAAKANKIQDRTSGRKHRRKGRKGRGNSSR